MRYLFKCLQYMFFFTIPAFASLFVWIYSSMSSSGVGILEKVLTYFSVNYYYIPGTNVNLSKFVLDGLDFIADYFVPFIYQLNYWIPVRFIIGIAVIGIYASMCFLAFRLILKVITLGQV